MTELRSLTHARELREYADALDKDRGHGKSRVTAVMRQAADEIDEANAYIAELEQKLGRPVSA